ncbi:flagellar motor switch protein FliN [Lysobacter korlensis]|uniref:Flagellar motor switch protein FliN n=1 Tax=Lysobacter korlensis TaxID=553636 RepID=A0ABV6RUQ7_9GAMM
MTETMTDNTLQTAAAEAFAKLVPASARLAVRRLGPAERKVPTSDAIVVTFVGKRSADLAVVLRDPRSLDAAAGDATGLDATVLDTSDILRPALEAAVEGLGSGVLGEADASRATDLFADPETAAFELSGADGFVAWFAIRIRREQSAPRPVSGFSEKLGRISDVEMALTVEIGRTRMSVREVLGLEPGAVIELDRSAGAPADVLLNGRLIAHGEIVVVDQDYAVRITQILDTTEAAR